MQTFQQYVWAIGAFQGFLLFVLLVTDPRVSSASRLLGILCLFFALFLCLPFIVDAGPESPLFWSVGWIFYLPASMGGMAYLYCRNSILSETFSTSQLIHFAPLLASYILVGDYIVVSPEKLAAWIYGGSYSSARLAVSEYIMFVQAFFYLSITLRLLARYKRRASDMLANFNPDTFRWLAVFMFLLLLIWVLKAVFAFASHVPGVIYYGSDIMIVALIYVVAAAQWRHPELFKIHQHGKQNLAVTLQMDEGANGSTKARGQLDPETRVDLLTVVKEKIEASELFRDNNLTLTRLARATGLKTHHLSEVINQQAGQNFYQFINSYRIEYVCARLKDNSDVRVLDIAMDAGFSSKSTFNSIFKQFKGMTPTQYRKTIEKEGQYDQTGRTAL